MPIAASNTLEPEQPNTKPPTDVILQHALMQFSIYEKGNGARKNPTNNPDGFSECVNCGCYEPCQDMTYEGCWKKRGTRCIFVADFKCSQKESAERPLPKRMPRRKGSVTTFSNAKDETSAKRPASPEPRQRKNAKVWENLEFEPKPGHKNREREKELAELEYTYFSEGGGLRVIEEEEPPSDSDSGADIVRHIASSPVVDDIVRNKTNNRFGIRDSWAQLVKPLDVIFEFASHIERDDRKVAVVGNLSLRTGIISGSFCDHSTVILGLFQGYSGIMLRSSLDLESF